MELRLGTVMAIALMSLGLVAARAVHAEDPESPEAVVQRLLEDGDLAGATLLYERTSTRAWTQARHRACEALSRAWTVRALERQSRAEICRALLDSCQHVLATAERACRSRGRTPGGTVGAAVPEVPSQPASAAGADLASPPWHKDDPLPLQIQRDALRREFEVAKQVFEQARVRRDRWATHAHGTLALLRRVEDRWFEAVAPAAALYAELLNHLPREERLADPDRLLLAADLNRQTALLRKRRP